MREPLLLSEIVWTDPDLRDPQNQHSSPLTSMACGKRSGWEAAGSSHVGALNRF